MDKIRKALEKNGKYWIAFVGDSSTSTEWVHPNWREIVEYVLKDILQKEMSDWRLPSWGIRCFNFGFDGATTKDLLEKMETIIEHKPDLVVVMAGGNDPILGISKENHKNNVLAMAKKLALNNIELVYTTGSKPWNKVSSDKYLPYVEVDRDLKLDNLIDLYKESEDFPSERIYTFESEEIPEENIKEGDLDFCHPNQLGNAYVAKIILKEVFGVDFDPEKYIETTAKGYKYPEY